MSKVHFSVKIVIALFLALCFIANPVLCALSFALGWGIVYGIVFGIVTFLEIGFLTCAILTITDN